MRNGGSYKKRLWFNHTSHIILFKYFNTFYNLKLQTQYTHLHYVYAIYVLYIIIICWYVINNNNITQYIQLHFSHIR